MLSRLGLHEYTTVPPYYCSSGEWPDLFTHSHLVLARILLFLPLPLSLFLFLFSLVIRRKRTEYFVQRVERQSIRSQRACAAKWISPTTAGGSSTYYSTTGCFLLVIWR